MVEIVPEVSEADARGETADIYEQIRLYRGLHTVSLFYRQLAAISGGLPWAWSVLRPLVVSGEIIRAGEGLVVALNLPLLPSIRRSALRLVGVDAAAETAIRSVLDTLNWVNPINLVTTTCLKMALQGNGSRSDASRPAHGWQEGQPPATVTELPPWMHPTKMSGPLADLIVALGSRGDDRIVAGMYRHMAHWPGYVAIAAILLLPRLESGEIDEAGREMLEPARTVSERLVSMLPRNDETPPLTAAARTDVETVLDNFLKKIPEMTIVGKLLRDAMPDD